MLVKTFESRRLLASTWALASGTLTVNGTAGADSIYITVGNNNNLKVMDQNVQIGAVGLGGVGQEDRDQLQRRQRPPPRQQLRQHDPVAAQWRRRQRQPDGDAGLGKLFGGVGDDTLYVRKPGNSLVADNDTIDGGAGADKAQVDASDSKTLIETLLA
jgi:hypothetical protein